MKLRKVEMENGLANGRQGLLQNVRVAPSVRIPVTEKNREYLRWLRAAELSAWEDADPKSAACVDSQAEADSLNE